MGYESTSGLRHCGDRCKRQDDTTNEEVWDSVIAGATFRRCRVCGVGRTAYEDAYGRPIEKEQG